MRNEVLLPKGYKMTITPQPWISVCDALPDAGDDGYARVLGWDGVRVSEMYFHPRMKDGDQWSSHAGHESPTHWMPLPAPPETSK
jgi:hypothetical protein